MKNTQEFLSLAYESGKILQVKYDGEWIDFVPQNQLDSPNFEHSGIINWRVKPIEDVQPTDKSKYPIGGYAPGAYTCTCVTCKNHFIGDKRAVQCEPCAIKEAPKTEELYTYDELRTIAYKVYCEAQLKDPSENKFNKLIQEFKKQ